MRSRSLVAVLCLALPTAAAAATVSIEVHGPDGRPLEGAVVWMTVPGAPPPAAAGPYAVEQRNISFQPHVLIVPVGASVEFPNRDKVRHHVYSFSKPKRFNLKLYGQEERRTVTFDKPGVVALGCNIHDAMNGYVFVTQSRYTALANASGQVDLKGVPPGKAVLNVWHPSIRSAGNTLVQPATVSASGLKTVLTISR